MDARPPFVVSVEKEKGVSWWIRIMPQVRKAEAAKSDRAHVVRCGIGGAG